MCNRVLSILSPLLMLLAAAAAAQSDDQRTAMMSIVGLDLTSADIVEWCDAGGAGAPARSAWTAWRVRHGVDDVRRRLDAAALQKTRDGMVTVIATTRQKLTASGQPATVCPQLTSMWTSESFNARAKYPAAYTTVAVATDPRAPAPVSPATGAGVVNSAVARSASAAPAPTPHAAFDPQYYASVARPTGTYYTASQFRELVHSWWGTPSSYERANDMRRKAGTLFVRGRVIKHRDSFFVEDNDGTFASTASIDPDIPVAAFEGQEITVQGTLDELPGSLVFLRGTRVVRDPSGLTPSTISQASGRYRIKVGVEQITASAGRGLRVADIQGMLYNGYGATGANGYEFREELRLLLKDGWVYYRDDISPTDLDIAASRRLEPQAWGRWRAAGSGFEMQRQDDNGQLAGEWRKQVGRMLSAWARDTRIVGSYNAKAFYGSIALGGTYSSTSYVFRADGTYEQLGFSRSSSGSMAANAPVEFSASASSSSNGKGTESAAGGGLPGVYARSSSRTDDGAKHRGTYRLDGMMIELRTDAGDVIRTLCLPMGADHKALYLFGRSFSVDHP